MTTYYLSATDSDLTGGTLFNKVLALEVVAPTELSSNLGNGQTATSFGYTPSGVPGNQGVTGNYTVKVVVSTGSTDIFLSVRLARVNSSGVEQTVGTFTAEQQATAGVKTFSGGVLNAVNLGTWAAGDRLRVGYRARNAAAHATRSYGVTVGSTDAEVVAPWTIASIISASGTLTGTATLTGAGAGETPAATVERTGSLAGTGSLSAVGEIVGGFATVERTGSLAGVASVSGVGRRTAVDFVDAVALRTPDHWFRFSETAGTNAFDQIAAVNRTLTLINGGTLNASTGIAEAGSGVYLPRNTSPSNTTSFLNPGQMATFWERTERTHMFIMATTDSRTEPTTVYGHEDDGRPDGWFVEWRFRINRWYDYNPATDTGVYTNELGALEGWYGVIDDYFGAWSGRWQWWNIRAADTTVNWRDGNPHLFIFSEKLDPTNNGLHEFRLWIDGEEQPINIGQSGQFTDPFPVLAPRTYSAFGGTRFAGSTTNTLNGIDATYDEYAVFPGMWDQADADEVYRLLTLVTERTGSLAGVASVSAVGVGVLERTATTTGTGSLSATGEIDTPSTSGTYGHGTYGEGTYGAVAFAIVSRSGSLAGVGALTADAAFFSIEDRTATLAGVGALDATGVRVIERTATVAGIATLTASAEASGVVERAGSVAGVGALAADGLRISERTATLSGVATFDAVGTFFSIAERTATLAGTASLSGVGVRIVGRTATTAGVATLDAAGINVAVRTASLAGVATLVADGAIEGAVVVISRTATLSGSATLAAAGTRVVDRTGATAGVGSLTSTGVRVVSRTASVAGAATLTASAEASGVVSRTGTTAGTATLSGVGEFETPFAVISRTGSLVGTASLTASSEASGVVSRTGTITGTATLSADGHRIVAATAALIGTALLTAQVLTVLSRSGSVHGQATLLGSVIDLLSRPDAFRVELEPIPAGSVALVAVAAGDVSLAPVPEGVPVWLA